MLPKCNIIRLSHNLTLSTPYAPQRIVTRYALVYTHVQVCTVAAYASVPLLTRDSSFPLVPPPTPARVSSSLFLVPHDRLLEPLFLFLFSVLLTLSSFHIPPLYPSLSFSFCTPSCTNLHATSLPDKATTFSLSFLLSSSFLLFYLSIVVCNVGSFHLLLYLLYTRICTLFNVIFCSLSLYVYFKGVVQLQ